MNVRLPLVTKPELQAKFGHAEMSHRYCREFTSVPTGIVKLVAPVPMPCCLSTIALVVRSLTLIS